MPDENLETLFVKVALETRIGKRCVLCVAAMLRHYSVRLCIEPTGSAVFQNAPGCYNPGSTSKKLSFMQKKD
jgi:hypothetical protein